ncbi:MAG: hypothetical protein WCP45_01010 [Verrucomicrobiota bacterium]
MPELVPVPQRPRIPLLRRPAVRWLLVLAACWALALLGPLSWLMVPALCIAVGRASRRRAWVALALLVICNPLSAVIGGGLVTYLGGAPALRSRDLTTLEASNLDRATRCFRSGGACLVPGNAWLFIHTHNAAVRLMHRAFGTPSKSYDGPYPTRQEALAFMANALLTPVDEFHKGWFLADGDIIRLQPSVVEGLGRLTGLKNDTITPVRARVYQGRCVIVRMSRVANPANPADGLDADFIVLIDKRHPRPFAFYQLTGAPAPAVPPVTYPE